MFSSNYTQNLTNKTICCENEKQIIGITGIQGPTGPQGHSGTDGLSLEFNLFLKNDGNSFPELNGQLIQDPTGQLQRVIYIPFTSYDTSPI